MDLREVALEVVEGEVAPARLLPGTLVLRQCFEAAAGDEAGHAVDDLADVNVVPGVQILLAPGGRVGEREKDVLVVSEAPPRRRRRPARRVEPGDVGGVERSVVSGEANVLGVPLEPGEGVGQIARLDLVHGEVLPRGRLARAGAGPLERVEDEPPPRDEPRHVRDDFAEVVAVVPGVEVFVPALGGVGEREVQVPVARRRPGHALTADATVPRGSSRRLTGDWSSSTRIPSGSTRYKTRRSGADVATSGGLMNSTPRATSRS